jgi:ABC-type Fe3+/spermidine/putrescine transport system ATPase subunit
MLEAREVYKQYQEQPLLEGISLRIGKKETVCVLGPSGGGKSTLLRIIAGLELPDSGSVLWLGEDITARPPHLRQFGFMFQDYALFPHMSVRENVSFGLQMQKVDNQAVDERVREALDMVDMGRFENRRVTDLSGGEQQRVALARTLAPRPNLLMLDEPLGALDRTLRAQLGSELRDLLRRIQIPVIYVTHDQDEAFTIADRVMILNKGHFIQSGTPVDVYTHPQTLWLASFLGMENRLNGRVESQEPMRVTTDLGVFECDCVHNHFVIGELVTLVLRPTAADIAGSRHKKNILKGEVVDTVYSADRYRITIQAGPQHHFAFYLNSGIEPRQRVRFAIQPEAILCYQDLT